MEVSGKLDLRVVTPYRPFPPESQAHRLLGEFDWIAAIEMLRHSVTVSNGIETVAITDIDTHLPSPSFRYQTTQRRLMLWILDIALQYLKSEDFDRDTVMISPDTLVFSDLRQWLGDYDIGVVARIGKVDKQKEFKNPILNAVQFWRVHAKERLVEFYRRLLDLAQQLPENKIVWGGDTIPLRTLLTPLKPGIIERCGLTVGIIDAIRIMKGARFVPGDDEWVTPDRIVDFKYLHKRHMRAYFEKAFQCSS